MFDRWEYKITHPTSEADREKVPCKISTGILTDLMIYYPEGCHGLARCRVFLGEKPVAPRSPKLYLAGNDTTILITDMRELIRPNLPVLNWEVWNVDESYDHTLWLAAGWISREELYEREALTVMEQIAKSMKELEKLLVGRQIS